MASNRDIVGAVPYNNLVKEVSVRTEMPVYKVKLIVDTLFVVIKEQLYQRMKVAIPGFGIFFLKHLKGRLFNIAAGMGRTHEIRQARQASQVYKPDRSIPQFVFEKKFREQVQRKTAFKKEDLEELVNEES